MAPRVRPTLHLRLTDHNSPAGEIPLADLANVAQHTQRLVTQIARGMIDDQIIGRPRRNIVRATTLTLVGLRSGSTILDIAMPETSADTLRAEDMPPELGEMALTVLAESMEILYEDDPTPVLPVGADERIVNDIDIWLRSLRGYSQISIETKLNRKNVRTEFAPKDARARLKRAAHQPSLPYVSADNQVLTGRLYALNLRTGTFRIEDDARHSIQLNVPEDVREEAARLVNTRVRTYGQASVDHRHRLLSFNASALESLPEFMSQTAFFERHELLQPPRAIEEYELQEGVIEGLSDEEIDAFITALDAE